MEFELNGKKYRLRLPTEKEITLDCEYCVFFDNATLCHSAPDTCLSYSGVYEEVTND